MSDEVTGIEGMTRAVCAVVQGKQPGEGEHSGAAVYVSLDFVSKEKRPY
jgi:hypothetical protein